MQVDSEPLKLDQEHLLETKLFPPVRSENLVENPELQKLIDASEHASLILVRAPAGFGKTTFMYQWQQQLKRRGRDTAWLTLDEADNEPSCFLAYLFAAIQQAIPDFARGMFGSPILTYIAYNIDVLGTFPQLCNCTRSPRFPARP